MKQSSLYSVVMLAISGTFVVGCSVSDPEAAKNTSTDASQQTEESIKSSQSTAQIAYKEYISPLPEDAPVIKVATEANYTPFEFKNEFGKVVGFDIDLIRAVGENQGFKVEIHNDPWTEVFTNLESGKRHMIAAGLGNNLERKTKYEISNPYIVSHSAIAYLADRPKINNKAEFGVLKIAGVEDTNIINTFKADVKDTQFKLYPTLYLAIQSMMQGETDAVISESNVLQHAFSELDVQPQYFIYNEDAAVDEFTGIFFAIEKGNKDLLNQVNAGLQAVEADGTYAKLTEKWFGSDLTPALVEQRRKLNQ